MDTIRVLIADDQTISRSGIRSLLATQEDIDIVGEAQNGEEAFEFASSIQPDVILMDLRKPGINGIDATRRIHRTFPHIGILARTVFEDDTSVFPAIRAGARGYFIEECRTGGAIARHPHSSRWGCDLQPWDRTERLGLSVHPSKGCTRAAFR